MEARERNNGFKLPHLAPFEATTLIEEKARDVPLKFPHRWLLQVRH
jgi:hypothetical protein